MPGSKGYRSQTRDLLTKDEEKRGTTKRFLEIQNLDIGDKVVISIDSSFHKGMPHRRYHGKIATVVSKRGRSFELETSKGNKKVRLLVRPQHMRIYQESK